MKATKELFKLQDMEYALFQSKLTPTLDISQFIGVRVPEVRRLAKTYINDPECDLFINTLPHEYYDENMLHGILISLMKDYDKCIEKVNKFLPYVDNWAVCDIMSPKIFKKNKELLIVEIKKWLKSKHPYTIRFGIEMLMSHYLDDDFKEEYLYLVKDIKSTEYYVNMMIAWYFATSLSKKWDETIKIVESKELDKWVQNKLIQKARESYKITKEQKEYLNFFKK